MTDQMKGSLTGETHRLHACDMRTLLSGPGFFRIALATTVFLTHMSRLSIGVAAVYVFFVLSGFWIAEMWKKKYTHCLHPYRTYLVSRGWRLIPVFLISSALANAVYLFKGNYLGGDGTVHRLVSNLIIFGYRALKFRPIGPAWSLDVEAQFYLFAPLLLMVSVRPFLIMLLCFGLSVLSLGFFQDQISFMPYLVFFAAGLTASQLQWIPSRVVAYSSLWITFLGSVVLLCSPLRDVLLTGAHPRPLAVYNPQMQVLIAITLYPWAIFTTSQRTSRIDHVCADLSYVVYLMHWSFMEMIDTGDGSPVHRLEMIAICTMSVFVTSGAVWKYIDLPINRRRQAWVRNRVDMSVATLPPQAYLPKRSSGGL